MEGKYIYVQKVISHYVHFLEKARVICPLPTSQEPRGVYAKTKNVQIPRLLRLRYYYKRKSRRRLDRTMVNACI